MLPFFFRHYDRYVERYVFYDDGSNDRTAEILSHHSRVELRRLPRSDSDSFIQSAATIRDNVWKESRGQADWVIVTDVDEHLYHPELQSYLHCCRKNGVTIIPALGFQMVTREFPDAGSLLCRDHTKGVPNRWMNKLGIFNPNAIEETLFRSGRHSARPKGLVRYPPSDTLLNLHYKYLGLEFVQQRNAELLEKLGPDKRDISARPGWSLDRNDLLTKLEAWLSKAIDISELSRRALDSHIDSDDPWYWRSPPWWRLRGWHLQWWWLPMPYWARARVKAIIRCLKSWVH